MRQFIRVWKELDLKEIEQSLLVIGELSAECYSCRKLGIEIKSYVCPQCGVAFKYVGFRRRVNPSYLNRIKEDFNGLVFIDFDDFKAMVNKRDARDLLGE